MKRISAIVPESIAVYNEWHERNLQEGPKKGKYGSYDLSCKGAYPARTSRTVPTAG